MIFVDQEQENFRFGRISAYVKVKLVSVPSKRATLIVHIRNSSETEKNVYTVR